MRPIGYMRPSSLEAAVTAFSAAGTDARYIAGGTTLFDLMKLGVERPSRLVDLSGISGLGEIETGGNDLRFGAMTLMSDVAATPIVQAEYPVLCESLLKAASQQLRNMATVGGNLLQRTRCAYFRAGDGMYPCNKRSPGSGCAAIGGIDRGHAVLGTSEACTAVSPGDWPVALVALGARVEVFGPGGRRTLPLAEFYRLPGETPHQEFALQPGELIAAIIVPKTRAGRASAYHKIRDRESFAFALAAAAVALDIEGGVIREAHIALGGVATVPWRARAAEDLLRGRRLTPELAIEAGRAAFTEARLGRHNRFKVELGARVVADALAIAADRRPS